PSWMTSDRHRKRECSDRAKPNRLRTQSATATPGASTRHWTLDSDEFLDVPICIHDIKGQMLATETGRSHQLDFVYPGPVCELASAFLTHSRKISCRRPKSKRRMQSTATPMLR